MKIFFVILPLFLFSCINKKPHAETDTHIIAPKTGRLNYDSCKKVILAIKNDHKKNWNKLPVAQQEKIFTEAITQTILPNWVGTTWSFNGTSETPQEDKEESVCSFLLFVLLEILGNINLLHFVHSAEQI